MAGDLKKSISKKLLVVLFSIVFLVGLVYFSEKQLAKTAQDVIDDIAIQQDFETKYMLDMAKNNLISLSNTIETNDYSTNKLTLFLKTQLEILGFDNLFFLDKNNEIIVSSVSDDDIANINYPAEIASNNSDFIASYVSGTTGNTVIGLRSPLIYCDGMAGYIYAEYSIELIFARITVALNQGGYGEFLDENGNILFSTIDYYNTYGMGEFKEDMTSQTNNSGVHTLVLYADKNSLDGIMNIRILAIVLIVFVYFAFSAFGIITYYTLKSKMKAEKKADYDELTGLPNLEKFKKEVEKILTANPNKKYGLVKVDIKNFKAVNEIFSYEVGDKVLCAFKKVNDIVLEKTFIMGRSGGDQFVMFAGNGFFDNLDNISPHYEAYLKQSVVELSNYHLSFTYGRYFIEEGNSDLNDIFNKLNIAHNIAKTNEGSKVCDFEQSYKEKILRIAEITNKMEKALKGGELGPYLQPKFDLKENVIKGAEALVRWTEPSGKMIFPDEFIPLFESNGFIIDVDKYVLEQICIKIREWLDHGYDCVPISVNFSRMHLINPDFISGLIQIVDKHEVPHNFIEIELTETTISDNESALEKLFDDLHRANFAVSIDDFGSGYSSLGMLQNFKVDTLKLDRSFLINKKKDGRGALVIEGIVKLAHSIGINLVAEGVEEEEQVEFLKSLNCELAQGYFYSRPIPLAEFEDKYIKPTLANKTKYFAG